MERGASRVIELRGRSPMWLTSGPDAVLYVSHAGGVVTAYPVAGGAPVDVLDVGRDESVSAIGAEVDGGQLMVVGYDSGLVELWNLETGAFVTELSQHSSSVTSAVIGQSTTGLRVSTTTAREGVVRTLDDPHTAPEASCPRCGPGPERGLNGVASSTPPPPALCPRAVLRLTLATIEPGRSG